MLANTSGFVYYVSITGITGTAAPDAGAVGDAVARIKRHTTCRSRSASASHRRAGARHRRRADGVVVGSALVDALSDSLDAEGKATAETVNAVADLVAELVAGVRAAPRVRPRNSRLFAGSLPGASRLADAIGIWIASYGALRASASTRRLHELDHQRRPAENPQPPQHGARCRKISGSSVRRPAQLVFYKDLEANQFVIPGSELSHAHGRGWRG